MRENDDAQDVYSREWDYYLIHRLGHVILARRYTVIRITVMRFIWIIIFLIFDEGFEFLTP